MDILAIDFESFYSREYGLQKMTTQEYVLSPHFECICVAVVWNGLPTSFTGTLEGTKEWLQRFPWKTSMACAHNAMFDSAILEWIFDIHPKMWFCTMMSSRPICAPFTIRGKVSLATIADYYKYPAKGTEVTRAIGMRRRDFTPGQMKSYLDYCEHDAILSHRIFKEHVPQMRHPEIKLIDATIKKFCRPVLMLDAEVVRTRLVEVLEEKESVLAACGLHNRDMLMSNEQFAAALIMFGVDPPRKISPRTGKENWAFAKVDLAFKALLEHEDVRVQLIVAARLKVKSTQEETRLKRFLDVSHVMDATDSAFGVPLLYCAAHTHRFGGWDKLNLQNLGRGSALRRAIVAAFGQKIVAGDLSQIEARITAMLAGQYDLVEQFRNGEDVYSLFASKLFGFSVSKADTTERFVGKTCILGLGFGVAANTLYASLKLKAPDTTLDSCIQYVNIYRATNDRIVKLWAKFNKEVIHAMVNGTKLDLGFGIHTEFEAIVLPNGMKLRYPNLHQIEGEVYKEWVYDYRGKETKIYGAKLVENLVQALARIIIAAAEIRLYDAGFRAAMQVHDELIFSVPDNLVGKFSLVLERVLTQPVSWMPELPIAAEVSHGATYADAK